MKRNLFKKFYFFKEIFYIYNLIKDIVMISVNQAFKNLGVENVNSYITQNTQKVFIKGLDGRTKALNIIVEDDLDKGIIVEEISNSQNITICKLGSEIKNQLKNKKNQEELCKINLVNKLAELRSQIPIEPTEKVSQCLFRGANINSISFPKQYNNNILWGGKDSIENISLRNPLLTPEAVALELSEQQKELARQYNNTLYDYINCLAEIVHMDSLINNLSDDQSYPLTNHQLITLGF